jgi:hypothetical protein
MGMGEGERVFPRRGAEKLFGIEDYGTALRRNPAPAGAVQPGGLLVILQIRQLLGKVTQ